MQRLLTINRSLATEDEAQDLLEYAMLIGLIALICIVAVTTVGQTVFTLFWDRIATTI